MDEVVADLWVEVNESIATLTWAQAGLQRSVEMIKEQPVHPTNPDPRMIMGHGDPNDPDARILAEWRRTETIAKLSPGGDAFNRMGRDWVVSIYQAWEDDLRPRIAKAARVAKADVISEVFGDLRHIRHDIVHRRGVATAEHSAKATLLGWFGAGEPIVIRGVHLLDFKDKLAAHPPEITSS